MFADWASENNDYASGACSPKLLRFRHSKLGTASLYCFGGRGLGSQALNPEKAGGGGEFSVGNCAADRGDF